MRRSDGVFGPYSAFFRGEGCLYSPRSECGDLNIHGLQAEVSVVAWVKRSLPDNGYDNCQAVAGIWNEHGLRQYCLFLNLRIHNSAEQVCGHISGFGGPTTGYKYCMDAAIGQSIVPLNSWQCIGMTYDGQEIRVYLNGKLDKRERFNPYPYVSGIFDGGPAGADFTVGAVERPAYVDDNFQEHGAVLANNFYGYVGGLAVYVRALPAQDMQFLASLKNLDRIAA